MAIATNTREFEVTDASQSQTVHQSHDHATTQNGFATADSESAIRVCQRHAWDQTRRAKQHARYRDYEAMVVRRSATDGRSAEADVRDRRGEVV